MEVTWRDCMELSRVICASVVHSQDEELMQMTLGQLSKIKKIIEDETKAFFENTTK